MAKKYNEVTPEILEQFKAIVPGKVYAGEEINSDYFHDEMPIYGKGAPEVVIEATTTEGSRSHLCCACRRVYPVYG